ncbi:unnamed protein product [Didymodactylos carnosus]|uniref:Uncharacterized protein n=1 Tax=Didymodactylos carnosus TaxID=1234261 RepID=A0A8S2H3G2_9BILA|nr:unnamed protein product [Didymodactylos carnosus]CAF3591384.1 unnamed protein product [Didymodactylos carnosus]
MVKPTKKDVEYFNKMDDKNMKRSTAITAAHSLNDFFNSEHQDLLDILENFRALKMDPLTVFHCLLIILPHVSDESQLYSAEKKSYTTMKLFSIICGDSVSNKSTYIKLCRQAISFMERMFREHYVDKNGTFSSCIESLTHAKLTNILERTSVFISSDEDIPLSEIGFYEPKNSNS